MRLTFLEAFEFGIPEVDLGHRRIFGMFNEIGDSMVGGDFDSALRQVIHLIAVERAHVKYETSLLERYNSSLLGKHDEYHQSLFNSLNEMMDALGDQDKEAARKCYAGLYENIIDDILVADLPFKSLFQEKLLNR